MDLSEDKRAQSDTPVAFSVRNPATLPELRFCGAGTRLCSGRPGSHPVFLVYEVATQWWAPAGGHELVASLTR